MNSIRRSFLRFAAVVVAVDLAGLGAWALLPAESAVRPWIVFGTLVVAPLLGFLVVYAPVASRASE